jgi:nucleotidyltransferase/DNA polymerase involved in DNA repair
MAATAMPQPFSSPNQALSETAPHRGFFAFLLKGWETAVIRAARPDLSDVPIAVGAKGRVIEPCPAALHAGVSPGLKFREARSRLPTIEIIERDEALSWKTFLPVAKTALKVCPFVYIDRPGRLSFPLASVLRYYETLENFVNSLLALLPDSPVFCTYRDEATPLHLGVGIGPSEIKAYLAAFINADQDAFSGKPTSFRPDLLEALPIEILYYFTDLPDSHDLEILHLSGIHTLAHLSRIDPAHLADRFGKWAADACSLIRSTAQSHAIRYIPEQTPTLSWTFDPPADSREQVLFAARRLAEELITAISGAGYLPRYLRLEALDQAGALSAVSWSVDTSLSSLLVSESLRTLRWHVEMLDNAAPITELRLVCEEITTNKGFQLSFDIREQTSTDTSDTGEQTSRATSQDLTFAVEAPSFHIYGIANASESVYRAICRIEALLGQQSIYFVRPYSFADRSTKSNSLKSVKSSNPVLPSKQSYLPHEEAVLVPALLDSIETHFATSKKLGSKRKLGSKCRHSPQTVDSECDFAAWLDNKESVELSFSPATAAAGAFPPGHIPPPQPALTNIVSLLTTPLSALRSPIPHSLQKDISLLEHQDRLLLPVSVFRGPRSIAPPETVDRFPVISSAGPWRYMLEWWSKDRAICGELWQIAIAIDGIDRKTIPALHVSETACRDTSATGAPCQVALLLFRSDVDGTWYIYAVYD